VVINAIKDICKLAEESGRKADWEEFKSILARNYGYYDELRERFLIEIHMRSWLGASLSEAFKTKIDEDFLSRSMQTLIDHRARTVVVFPHVLELLQTLRGSGRILGVVTNTSSESVPNRVLEATRLKCFFDIIVTSAQFGVRKPYPGIFLHALERLGARPRQSVFVGDSMKHDIVGARSVGMKTVILTHGSRFAGHAAADAQIDRVEKLPEALASLE